jgi:hypothetical protein
MVLIGVEREEGSAFHVNCNFGKIPTEALIWAHRLIVVVVS